MELQYGMFIAWGATIPKESTPGCFSASASIVMLSKPWPQSVERFSTLGGMYII